MSRSFAVFDIDGTLIRWQLYHAIVDALAHQGIIAPNLHQKVRTSRLAWKRRTHLESFKDYEKSLVVAYEQVLTQITIKQYEQAVQAVFDEYKDQVYRYSRNLIRDLRKQNYLLFAISGSQQEVIAKIAAYYHFDDFVGTAYEQANNRFTGKKASHLGSKHLILQTLVDKHQAGWQGSLAIGDSESDISMLEAVERPIAFNPTRALFEQAKQKGWPVVIERKNMIYELAPKDRGYWLKEATI